MTIGVLAVGLVTPIGDDVRAVIGRALAGETALRAQEKLAYVAEGIRAGRFDATPTPMGCGYCPFREICPDASR